MSRKWRGEEKGREEGAGKRRSIIGETIYTRRVQLQSDRTFPRNYVLLRSSLQKSARNAPERLIIRDEISFRFLSE